MEQNKDSFAINFWNSIFYYYGKCKSFMARKNKITGNIDCRFYNESFGYWSWVRIDKSKLNLFIKN